MIRFGPGGIPISAKEHNPFSGIARLQEMGLHEMELEFVYQNWLRKEDAVKLKKEAEQADVRLTIHGSYYVNLNSLEQSKIIASKKRIFEACKIAHLCGASPVLFHAGFYQKDSKQKTFDTIKKQLIDLSNQLKKEKLNVHLGLELTGKQTQFGCIEELIELSESIDNIEPVIDFSHWHARFNGLFKQKRNFDLAIKQIPKTFLKNLHCHVSGIAFSEKGERNHLPLEDKTNSFNWRWLLESLKENNACGSIACESPLLEQDALLMQKYYQKL